MACEFVPSLKTSLLRYEGACSFTAFVIPQGEKKVLKLQSTHWDTSVVRIFMLPILAHSCSHHCVRFQTLGVIYL